MKQIAIFGAGNIGRSFLTPVFLDAGYGVTLIDIDGSLVSELNERGRYTLVILSSDGSRERVVDGYSAIPLSDEERVIDAVVRADLVASAVGQAGLPGVCGTVAAALERRREHDPTRPLDLILAENIRNGKDFCVSQIAAGLATDFPLQELLGIVETSIGKMVPTVSAEQRAADPLRLYAEPYNTLILDRAAFRGPLPKGPDIKLVTPIEAYVDRKLFVHNLGHAATAYHGRARHPEVVAIWEVLEDPGILRHVRSAMMQGAEAVGAEYPETFTRDELAGHVDDLLRRFGNASLGDTVQRVGRDLRRKLSRDDRVVGAMRLAAGHGLPFDAVASVYRSALAFGDHRQSEPHDREVAVLAEAGIRSAYLAVSATDGSPDEVDSIVLSVLEREGE